MLRTLKTTSSFGLFHSLMVSREAWRNRPPLRTEADLLRFDNTEQLPLDEEGIVSWALLGFVFSNGMVGELCDPLLR